MHTVTVLAGGFALLGVCVFAGKLAGGTDAAMAKGAMAFLPIWLVCAALNMWAGVARAGYSVREELPVLLVVFAVPAAAALAVLWRLKGH